MQDARISPPDFDACLQRARRCSRYVQRTLDSDPAVQDWLADHYTIPCNRAEMQDTLRNCGLDLHEEATLSSAVRRLRKRVMVKLILRDLNGLCGLEEVVEAMTTLAEVCVRHAQDCLMPLLQAQYGTPLGAQSGAPQHLLVIGMGKLGGGELNVSSDIDLIFVYPEDGETDGARTLGNHEFFTRLGRRLINLIHELTADGYVFRVDMRLRPYGDSGPLVMSFAALEEYLVSQGREWERYAWIKARVIAPAADPEIATLAALSTPFVFRKYLDFGAIDSMRKLHAQIRQEVQRRDRLQNIKLGPGGIREIEFLAQVFQLIRGGRDHRLRIRPTRKVLTLLALDEVIDARAATALDAAYVFLRNLEHRLQYLDDQQTQELPERPEDRALLAEGMGYADFDALLADLDVHRALVSDQFEHIFGAQEETAADAWHPGETAEAMTARLQALGYADPDAATVRLQQLRDGSRYRQLPESSRQRMGRLLPQLVRLSAEGSDPDTTLARLLTLLDSISRRASYLAFLAEYPHAMARLVTLAAASSWAMEYLTQHPALLDELLDAREIYRAPDWAELDRELQTRLEASNGDVEAQFDVLRHFKQEQTFHLLAMDLQGLLPLEKLSDHLSDLADLILRHVLPLAWTSVRKRHCDTPRFAIVAYGKLGGKELGYASDLDLIFLYDDDHPDAQENYARLGQRINTVLGSYTSSGRLYETDLRLRPNGASGLLVSTLAAFAEYQEKQAWVWEHQALTRARFSAGDTAIGRAFDAIRHTVLCQQRDPDTLRGEILSMRQKMLDGHPNPGTQFDIKHDRGGMVDIEFMVQYLVLAHAHHHPELTANIGNLALLDKAAALELIPQDLATGCGQLYRNLRQTQHRMRLNNAERCRVEPDGVNTTASRQLWRTLFGTD